MQNISNNTQKELIGIKSEFVNCSMIQQQFKINFLYLMSVVLEKFQEYYTITCQEMLHVKSFIIKIET